MEHYGEGAEPRFVVNEPATTQVVAALALLVASASAIYPDDHWDYSTKLTVENYKDVIQSTIDAGKTLMVRFIASAG